MSGLIVCVSFVFNFGLQVMLQNLLEIADCMDWSFCQLLLVQVVDVGKTKQNKTNLS